MSKPNQHMSNNPRGSLLTTERNRSTAAESTAVKILKQLLNLLLLFLDILLIFFRVSLRYPIRVLLVPLIFFQTFQGGGTS